MSKHIDLPLDKVETGPGGRPLSFRWRGRLWRVGRTAEVWKDTGRWWEGEGEKVFYRVEAAAGGAPAGHPAGVPPAGGRLVELYFDRKAGKWFLYRVYD